jgi:hypothetical protein
MLAAICDRNRYALDSARRRITFEDGELYCGLCGGRRRVRGTVLWSQVRDTLDGNLVWDDDEEK